MDNKFNTKEQKALEYAEKHGIIDYTVKGNIMTYYESYLNEGHYKATVDLNTMQETRKQVKKPWGWRVARDYINGKEEDCYRQGKKYRDYQGGKFRYRLKDDDGNTCYIIESDIDPDKGTEGQLFAPLDWAMADVGATSIEYKDKETGEYKYL